MANSTELFHHMIAELPAPIELTSSTTLDDVIAATILDNPLADDMNGTPSTSEPDAYLDHLLTSLLNDPPIQEQTTPVTSLTKSFMCGSPCPDNRYNNSLTGFASPTPINHTTSVAELQSLLRSETKRNTMPSSLLKTVQPPRIQLNTVSNRELQLQQRFHQLEFIYPAEIQQLSSFYRYQSALLETNRFQSLQQYTNYPFYYSSLNSYYDNHLHLIIDRVEVL